MVAVSRDALLRVHHAKPHLPATSRLNSPDGTYYFKKVLLRKLNVITILLKTFMFFFMFHCVSAKNRLVNYEKFGLCDNGS